MIQAAPLPEAAPKNPRDWSDADYREFVESLRAVGFADEVLVQVGTVILEQEPV